MSTRIQAVLHEYLSDTEKQLEQFNNFAPFKHNPDIYSPRLVNLLFMACAQIEAFCSYFVAEFGWTIPQGQGMRWVIAQLDRNGVLSKMIIKSTLASGNLTPFSSNYQWWQKYNDAKHDLVQNGYNVKYKDVMDAMAAYFALFNLALTKILTQLSETDLLDVSKWQDNTARQFWSAEHLFVTETAHERLAP